MLTKSPERSPKAGPSAMASVALFPQCSGMLPRPRALREQPMSATFASAGAFLFPGIAAAAARNMSASPRDSRKVLSPQPSGSLSNKVDSKMKAAVAEDMVRCTAYLSNSTTRAEGTTGLNKQNVSTSRRVHVTVDLQGVPGPGAYQTALKENSGPAFTMGRCSP